MKRAILADTGPLYAAVDPDDAYHSQSHEELARLTRDKREVLVAWPTLMEAYTLVLYKLGNATARSWLAGVLDTAIVVNPFAEDYPMAARLVSQFVDQQVTLFDATAATLATRLKVEVWTYDHHFDVLRVPVWR